MGDQVDGDFVVDVEPFGVVVHLFGDERSAGHEAEGLREVVELERAVEFAARDGPAGQVGEGGGDLVVGEVGHGKVPIKRRFGGVRIVYLIDGPFAEGDRIVPVVPVNPPAESADIRSGRFL